ncbi:MAG: HlyD family type I secretion periplasmic adaptor subunit [Desulfovibrionaceae bacterium]
MKNLDFMSDVDAALHRRGHPLAFVLSTSGFLFFFIFLIWANFAVLDQVTRGIAQIIPSQRTQEIQNLEGGILEKILVKTGAVVEKGEPLVLISNQSAESFYRDNLSKYYENMGTVARLTAFLNNTTPVYPDELKEKASAVIQHQDLAFKTSQEKYHSEISVLNSQAEQKEQEVKEILSRQSQITQSLRLAREQRNIAKPLLDQGIYSKVDYLAIEQKVVELQGELESMKSSLPRVRSAVNEAKERVELRKSEIRTQALEELNKRSVELTSVKEALAAGEDRVARTEIRAPVRSTVQRILIRTEGGVIKPGETIMELVPLDDTLLVEARISPTERGFIHPEQKAVVKVTTFDYSIYGGLDAVVEQISADTLEDKQGEFYYLVTLRTNSNVIEGRNGEKHNIIPGMTATVDILTGKKTVLDYLLKPILKAKDNALSER